MTAITILTVTIFVTVLAVGGENVDFCDSCMELPCDTTCSRNCSSYKIRFENDDQPFICSVGYKNDIDKFKRDNPPEWFEKENPQVEPPKLRSVWVYQREQLRRLRYPALKIDFLLPPGVKSGFGGGPLFPSAILMKFQSIADEDVQDSFYHTCPRQRLFDFHTYKPKYTFDMDNPRNITYDCMVGLNYKAKMRVYLITLQTIPGREIVYTVTAYVQQTENQTNFQSTIATNFSAATRSVHVVFEEPMSFTGQQYNVTLHKVEYGPINTTQLKTGEHSLTFYRLWKGKYTVQVAVLDGEKKFESKSYIIDATMLPEPPDSPPLHYLAEERTLQMIGVGVGITVGCLLVIVMVFMRKRILRNKETLHTDPVHCVTGLVLHPFRESNWILVMDRFEEYLQNVCNITLLPNKIEQNTSSGLTEWCKTNIGKASFVIVFYKENCFQPNKLCTKNTYYSYMLQSAVNKKKQSNNLHIYTASFQGNHCHRPQILSEYRDFHLMSGMQNLYNQLCCCVSDSGGESRQVLDEGRTELQALYEALAKTTIKQPVLPNNHKVNPDPKPPHIDFNPKPPSIEPPPDLSLLWKEINELSAKKDDFAKDFLSNTPFAPGISNTDVTKKTGGTAPVSAIKQTVGIKGDSTEHELKDTMEEPMSLPSCLDKVENGKPKRTADIAKRVGHVMGDDAMPRCVAQQNHNPSNRRLYDKRQSQEQPVYVKRVPQNPSQYPGVPQKTCNCASCKNNSPEYVDYTPKGDPYHSYTHHFNGIFRQEPRPQWRDGPSNNHENSEWNDALDESPLLPETNQLAQISHPTSLGPRNGGSGLVRLVLPDYDSSPHDASVPLLHQRVNDEPSMQYHALRDFNDDVCDYDIEPSTLMNRSDIQNGKVHQGLPHHEHGENPDERNSEWCSNPIGFWDTGRRTHMADMADNEVSRLIDNPMLHADNSVLDRTRVPVVAEINEEFDCRGTGMSVKQPIDNKDCHRIGERNDTPGQIKDGSGRQIRFEAFDHVDLSRRNHDQSNSGYQASVCIGASSHSLPADLTDFDSYSPAPPTDDSSSNGSIGDIMNKMKLINDNSEA